MIEFFDWCARMAYIGMATLFFAACAVIGLFLIGHKGGPRGR